MSFVFVAAKDVAADGSGGMVVTTITKILCAIDLRRQAATPSTERSALPV